jgi:4-diphosphocytidyl-2-C-methyl-D-erythritol kinase
MPALRDTGWAKLNLTLQVLGRRSDGFHEIRSLVAFAGFGDGVELDPGGSLNLQIEGPFAHALGDDNLILKAARAAADLAPGLKLGHFRLAKMLPVAAGLGGGSADAAAALRLLARANCGLTEDVLSGLAPKLGSDVSVCMASRPAVMAGRGEKVDPVRGFPLCGVLLANPGLPIATEAVYAALQAAALTSQPPEAEALDFHGSFGALLECVLPRDNDLETPAVRLVPEIREVLGALRELPNMRLARLSGSGPTCFALCANEDQAREAASSLAGQQPAWWIAASTLGAPRRAA